ncbi:hypothetical protein E4U54_007514 [Claviceps lovelessii]|nr:hypothetical protein E4U54_007514 [Claviceps lovelessii]
MQIPEPPLQIQATEAYLDRWTVNPVRHAREREWYSKQNACEAPANEQGAWVAVCATIDKRGARAPLFARRDNLDEA